MIPGFRTENRDAKRRGVGGPRRRGVNSEAPRRFYDASARPYGMFSFSGTSHAPLSHPKSETPPPSPPSGSPPSPIEATLARCSLPGVFRKPFLQPEMHTVHRRDDVSPFPRWIKPFDAKNSLFYYQPPVLYRLKHLAPGSGIIHG